MNLPHSLSDDALFEELELAEFSCRHIRLQVMMHAHRWLMEYNDEHGWTAAERDHEDEWWDAVYNDQWFDDSVCREGMTGAEIRAELERQWDFLDLQLRDLWDEIRDDWW